MDKLCDVMPTPPSLSATCKKNVLQHKLAHNLLDVVLVGEVRACVCVFVVISL